MFLHCDVRTCTAITAYTIDVSLFLGLFHLVIVGDVADVSVVHAAPIFRVEVCRLLSLYLYKYGVGIGVSIPPVPFQNRMLYIHINLTTYTF
jgi:hypothetical protein